MEINREDAQDILDTYEDIRETVFEIVEDNLADDETVTGDLYYVDELACFAVVVMYETACDCCSVDYTAEYVPLDEVTHLISERRKKRLDGR